MPEEEKETTVKRPFWQEPSFIIPGIAFISTMAIFFHKVDQNTTAIIRLGEKFDKSQSEQSDQMNRLTEKVEYLRGRNSANSKNNND